MSTANTAATAGGARPVAAPGRPARADTGRGEHVEKSVLFLDSGAGPKSEEDRMARPVRFDDPARNAAYWARIARIAEQAPPLTDDQRARIRAAFHQPETRRAAA